MNANSRQSSSSASSDKRVALCLSGGGFRAALFHLGALTRVAETGDLQMIDTVSAVSGGAVLAAHLAHVLTRVGSSALSTFEASRDEWIRQVVDPFCDFVNQTEYVVGTATTAFRRDLLAALTDHTVNRVRRLRGSDPTIRWDAHPLEIAFRTLNPLTLHDLPSRPRFIFNAVNASVPAREPWVFERDRMGDDVVGYTADARHWPVARAVAASACFPPVYSPMPVCLEAGMIFHGARTPWGINAAELRGVLRLTDGGFRGDNVGITAVLDHSALLVSDGGRPFRPSGGNTWFSTLRHALDVASYRPEILDPALDPVRNANGAVWSINGEVYPSRVHTPRSGYSASVVEMLARVRTDLDRFYPEEAQVLINHGYYTAANALNGRRGMHGPARALRAPFPMLMNEDRARQALRRSHGVLTRAGQSLGTTRFGRGVRIVADAVTLRSIDRSKPATRRDPVAARHERRS